MPTKLEYAYLAGIMDGEGTFGIYRSKDGRNHHLRCYVVNTDPKLITWLYDTFGGLVYSRKSKKNPHWKLKYEWVLCKGETVDLVELLLPYLIIKRDQAELAIKFRTSFNNQYNRNNPLPLSVLSFRDKCYYGMKSLNNQPEQPPIPLASGCPRTC